MKIARIIESKRKKHKPIFILKNIPEIIAGKKPEFIKLDRKGYFLIKAEGKYIYAGQVNKKNQMFRIIKGKNAEDIYNEIIKRKWISRMEHAAYLGSELKKAELFLNKKIKKYVQE